MKIKPQRGVLFRRLKDLCRRAESGPRHYAPLGLGGFWGGQAIHIVFLRNTLWIRPTTGCDGQNLIGVSRSDSFEIAVVLAPASGSLTSFPDWSLGRLEWTPA